MTVIPDLYSKQLRIDGNTIRQLQVPAQDLVFSFSDRHYATLSDGRKVILAKDRRGLGTVSLSAHRPSASPTTRRLSTISSSRG